MTALRELLAYARARRKWWLLPIMVLAMLLASVPAVSQQSDWVLAVYDANGDLIFTGTYASEAACRAAGAERIRSRPGATFLCGPRRIYRPR